MDLLALVGHHESKTLEFKRDLSSPHSILRTIVAFANTAGGIVLIGVEDETRHIRGVSNPLDLEERLASLISDQITPRLIPEIEILPWHETHVIAIQIFPSSSRPHYLRSEGYQKGIYVRVGSTNRKADSELVEEMRHFARNESHDEQPMPELDVREIDFDLASETFKPVRKLRRPDLETLRIVTQYQGKKVPTVGGILLFGRNLEQHFPDAWILAARFQGETKSAIREQIEIRAPLVTAVEEAIAFVHKHTQRGVRIGSVRRTTQWMIPPVAVREAVINAVVHADYRLRGSPIRIALFSDRIEVENPGLLPFGLTLEDIQRGVSKLRNRVIGRAFHALGLIEQWGSGIQRITEAYSEAGLTPPTLEELATSFRVTLPMSRTHAPVLDEKDQAILALLGREGASTKDIAEQIGLTTRTARTRLAKLVDLDLVHEVSASPNDPRRRYYRT